MIGEGRLARWWWPVSTHRERFGQSPKLSIMDYRGEIETTKKKTYNNEPKNGQRDRRILGEGSVSFAN